MAISVKLCANIDGRLRALAKEKNCSQHWIMVEAIRRYVEAEEVNIYRSGEAERWAHRDGTPSMASE